MKKPKAISAQMFVVSDITGGGCSEDGSNVVLEFKMSDGQVAPFQFVRRVADKLLSATQRSLHEARLRAWPKAIDDLPSAVGAISIKSSMMSFQLDPNGSAARIVIRGTDGPPLSIELLPEDFQPLRDKLDDAERLMSKARVRHQH